MYQEACRYQVCVRGVPEKIYKALLEGGFVLIIKGTAGTGKTTFALELLSNLPRDSTFYISTRESPRQLVKHHPWLKNIVNSKKLIDGRSMRVPLDEEFERLDVSGISAFLKSLNEKIESITASPSTIIIDSIDALKTGLGLPWNDFRLEKSLFDIVKSQGVNLVLVVERFDVIQLDYLADGVIFLKTDIIGGRTLRKMRLIKLRGQEISKPEYIYTLNEGRFKFFSCIDTPVGAYMSTSSMDSKSKKSYEGNAHKKLISSLDKLDKILGGGFSLGSFNLFEIGEDVNENFIIYLTSSLVKTAINSNLLLYMIPNAGVPASKILEILRRYFREEDIKKYIRFFVPEFYSSEDVKSEMVFSMPGKDLEKAFDESEIAIGKLLEELKVESNIGVIGADILEYAYSPTEIRRILAKWVSTVKASQRVEIIFARTHQETLDDLRQMASTHFVIENLDGTMVLYGKMPWTKYYAFVIDEEKGKDTTELKMCLEPIV